MFVDAILMTEGFGDRSRGRKLRALQQALDRQDMGQLEELAAAPLAEFSGRQIQDRLKGTDPANGRDIII